MPENVQLDEGIARVGSIVTFTNKAKAFLGKSRDCLKPPLKVVEVQNQGSTTNPYLLLMLQGSDGKQKVYHPSWLKEAN